MFIPKEKFRRSSGTINDSVLAYIKRKPTRMARVVQDNTKHKMARVVQDNTKHSVLLGVYQTSPDSICDAFRSSSITFGVKQLQNANDILKHCQGNQPSVIVLDQDLLGLGGFEVCEEIRTNMGTWGQQVVLVVTASQCVSISSQHDTQAVVKYLDRKC